MPFGWPVLILLTALAALAAVSLALRARPAGRAEMGIAASLFFFALVSGPVLVLGYLDVLTRANLAGLSLFVSGSTLALSMRGTRARDHLRACARAALSIALMPLAGLREAARDRRFAL